MTRAEFIGAYNIGHRDGKADVYRPNDYGDIFDIEPKTEGGKEEPIDTFRFKKMLVKEDMEKFQKFIDEHKRLTAVDKQKLYDEAMEYVEVQQRFYENTIHFADAICRLSQTCGISHTEAKAIIEESMEILKKIKTGGKND